MLTYIWQARLQSAWAARHTAHTQRILNAHTQRKHTQSAFGHVLDTESMSKHSGVLLKLHTQTPRTHAEAKEMWFQARKYVQLFRWFHLKLFISDCRQNKQFLCILKFKMSAFYNILYHPLPMGTTAVHKTIMAVPLVCNSCQPISLSWLFIASFVSCLCVSAGPLPIPLHRQCTHRDCS